MTYTKKEPWFDRGYWTRWDTWSYWIILAFVLALILGLVFGVTI